MAQTPPTPEGVTVNSGAFVLGQPKPPAFIMAIYRLDYNADTRKGPGQNVWNAQGGTLLADQPMNGTGPWFSGLRTQWHRQQLTDLRRAGIEVALLRTRPDDPLLPRELDAFVEALKEMKAQGMDYPLVGVDATAGQPDLDVIYAHIPAEFRAMQEVPGQNASGVLVYDLSLGADAKIGAGRRHADCPRLLQRRRRVGLAGPRGQKRRHFPHGRANLRHVLAGRDGLDARSGRRG